MIVLQYETYNTIKTNTYIYIIYTHTKKEQYTSQAHQLADIIVTINTSTVD